MDALRFLGGIRPAAPPQPPIAHAPPPPPLVQRQKPRAALLRLWQRGGGGGERPGAAVGGEVRGEEAGARPDAETDERKQGNWVLQMLRVQPRWVEEVDAEAADGGGGHEAEASGRERCSSCGDGGEEEGCAVGAEDDDGDDEVFDRASFSRLLKKVSLGDAKEYSKMSYLCNIAYMIPRIQPKCLRRYRLQFVTSSVQEKAITNPDQKQGQSTERSESPDKKSDVVENADLGSKEKEGNGLGININPFGAYHVMSSAASYLHSRAMGVIPFGSRNDGKNDPTIMATVNGENGEGLTLDEASFVATTNSVTSMVAAKEETRQAVADGLNSSRSCSCEWFICDDDQNSTRYFVVQGSDSIASWQANLLFEPVKFEGLNVLVHRGIYEAAKGIYHQLLPYVKSHMISSGEPPAALRFTGHSLGGSLALLVNLMLLMRGEVPTSLLLPVITFGSPCIMCGGDHLLRKLGLPKSHVQSITMHRDIVPRVFSCNYPDHVANILKLANGNFRSHPCLTNQKLLYAPMGEVLILQPEERLSPHHHLLPQDSGIYHLGDSAAGISLRKLRSAMSAFFNSPHPLEILKDKGAYGPKGAVYRDHDVNSYLRSVRGVVRKEARRLREAERERWQLILWWPMAVHGMLVAAGDHHLVDAVVQTARQVRLAVHGMLVAAGDHHLVDAVAKMARQVRRHAHQLALFLLPVKLLLLGALLSARLRWWLARCRSIISLTLLVR